MVVSPEPAFPAGLSLDDLRDELHAMLRAIDRDILNYGPYEEDETDTDFSETESRPLAPDYTRGVDDLDLVNADIVGHRTFY